MNLGMTDRVKPLACSTRPWAWETRGRTHLGLSRVQGWGAGRRRVPALLAGVATSPERAQGSEHRRAGHGNTEQLQRGGA